MESLQSTGMISLSSTSASVGRPHCACRPQGTPSRPSLQLKSGFLPFEKKRLGLLSLDCAAGTRRGGSSLASQPLVRAAVAEDRSSSEATTREFGQEILGVDIGGTSIKASIVDTRTGKLIRERKVIATPDPATPEACAAVIKKICDHFDWKGGIGVGVPAVVKQGTTWTAANIDKSWIGAKVEEIFGAATGLPVTVVNDADAAGYAEMGFGAGSGENERGVVFMVTFGTGIGTAMFVDGILVPNLELGHIELDGVEAEKAAAGVLVEREQWTWLQWSKKVSWYLSYLERLFWPNLFIVGGGVSNAYEKWLHLIRLPNETPIVPATMKNDAGIIGAAFGAHAREVFDKTHKPSQVEDLLTSESI